MDSFLEELEQMRKSGMFRSLRPLSKRGAGTVEQAGRTLINLSSNDYLGLAVNRILIDQFYALRT